LNEPEEILLVERCKAGDHEAFRILIEQHKSVIFGTAYLMMRDRAQAEDAVQEALIKMWQNLPSLRRHNSVKAWLVRIVVNEIKQQHRKKRLPAVSLELAMELNGDPDETETVAIHNEDTQQLRRALNTLPPEQREVVVLHYFSDLKVIEIAHVLNKSEGTVKSRLSRALNKLAVILRQDMDGAKEASITWK